MFARLADSAIVAATSSPSTSPGIVPDSSALDQAGKACADGAVICSTVRGWTGSYQTGLWAQTLVSGGLAILIIVVVGWILRVLSTRVIKELERRAIRSDGGPLSGLSRKIAGNLDTGSVTTVRRIQRVKAASSVLRNITSVIVWSAVVLMVLSQIGLNIAPLLASAGIIGVAVGFGAQSLVRDFLTGLFMILEDQYGVGDRVDLGQAKGTVVSVGMRITRVRADDSSMWYVPNGSILRVGNLDQGWGRSVVDIKASDASQLTAVDDVLNEAAERLSFADEWADDLVGPRNTVRIAALSHDALTIRLTMTTRTGAQWRFNEALRDAVLEAASRHALRLEVLERAAPTVVLTDPPSTALAAPAPPGPLDAATTTLLVVGDSDETAPEPTASDLPAHHPQEERATSHSEP